MLAAISQHKSFLHAVQSKGQLTHCTFNKPEYDTATSIAAERSEFSAL